MPIAHSSDKAESSQALRQVINSFSDPADYQQ